MKHHCHCGLKSHLQRFRAKKLGVLGITLMVLHILFHVAECLVLPAVFVALGGHAVEEQAAAADENAVVRVIDESVEDELNRSTLTPEILDFQQSLGIIRLELERE